jgi:putative membrane protein
MWHYGMNWWMWFGMASFWIVIALVVWALIRSGQRPSQRTAQEILDERYAKGELSKDEYEERRRVLINH